MSMPFSLNGVALVAEADGSLWWPAESLLVVADLHFEKGSSYARRGVLLPPFDTRATLHKLALAIERRNPRRVISLGDAFHDPAGIGRLTREDRGMLETLAGGREWIWVAGNHEGEAVPFGASVASASYGTLIFRHEPQPHPAPGEVAGHYHPKASVLVRGRRLTRPCFATDGARLVMPAFGAFTGGLDLLQADIHRHFGAGLRALVMGDGGVHAIPAEMLVSERAFVIRDRRAT